MQHIALLPIILVTALRETEDRVKGIEAGCDDFISNPVDKMELLARVRSLLKVKAYNDLMSNYRKELESEVNRRTEELKHALENLQQDITARKRAEETLRETTETLHALFQASPLAIIALDPDGNVTLWNKAAEQMFGWHESEVLGQFLPFVPEDNRDEHRLLRERVLRGEAFANIEVRRRKKDGSPIDISISTAPLRDVQGQVTGIMSVNTDITERKRAEEELRESEERYKALFDRSLDLVLYHRFRRSLHRCQRRRLESAWLYEGRDPFPQFCLALERRSASACNQRYYRRIRETGIQKNLS